LLVREIRDKKRASMKQTRTVVVYGNSLALSGIAAKLEGQPYLCVQQIKATDSNLPRQAELLKPDVLIFDLATAQPQDALALLKDYPRLLLLGIDLGSDRMFLWGGRPTRALTLEDLLQVIHSETHPNYTCEEKL
jgi:hypothetical protein